ncbi:hypothetical protein MetMK1DRAFT_00017440 [Metallosphaera yellowstonensis MK1]|uniref:Uncharacterized protein n=1 Tax=Metallosphaera yellowstonensis MK1 TaxID=671065 RepID=H2C5C1_9CREN|nr:hypothetical protein MetMK1DRAFT_00017440 [Metallosphaera yellowstonensis MK1]
MEMKVEKLKGRAVRVSIAISFCFSSLSVIIDHAG